MTSQNESQTQDSSAPASVHETEKQARSIREQLSRRIIGQEEVIEQVITAFFAGGHVLLMGVPGLAKTLLIRTFSDALGLKFNRIQFTPDLMPSDVTGTDVISSAEGERGFAFLSGPIFANIVLADEINRTPPKTQSALLEAMEEFQVSAAGKQYPLPSPFFVMATQNPIEQEGTYPLPIAALDRFLFKVEVDYPLEDEEMEMLFKTTSQEEQNVSQVLNRESVLSALETVRKVDCSDEVMRYATLMVRETRPKQSSLEYIQDMVEVGGSPRAVQALILGGKAHAAIRGRKSVAPADVRAIALPALRHRVIPSFHANAEGIDATHLIQYVIDKTPRISGDEETIEEEKRSFNLWNWLLGEPKPRRKRSEAAV